MRLSTRPVPLSAAPSPARDVPPPVTDATCVGSWGHIAWVRVWPSTAVRSADHAVLAREWIRACYQLTPRLERIGPWTALLDLGICTAEEATLAVSTLRQELSAASLNVRVGVGGSAVLAQLAATRRTQEQPVQLLPPAQAATLLRALPVRMLATLHPKGMVSPAVVTRLEQYGLRTLGHLARLDELALRRQFGTVGGVLFALAHGRDAQPLCPTPPPTELRIRQRFATPLAPDELLALVPQVAQRIERLLHLQGRRAGSLRLGVEWERGAVSQSHQALRQATDRSTYLGTELRRLLLPLLTSHQTGGAAQGVSLDDAGEARPVAGKSSAWERNESKQEDGERVGDSGDGITGLRVGLGDLAPIVPVQATFARTQSQRTQAIADVAETLASRHGRSLLFHPQVVAPAAIYSEDRYTLDDHWTRHNDDALPPTGTAHRRTDRALGTADVWQGVPRRVHWW